nr:MAG TPA: minor tail protein [Caudoviricetes sp.]
MPRKEVAPINLFDLFAKISLDTSEYDSGVKDVSKSGGSLASKLKNGLASAGKVAAAGIGAITAAAGAAVGGLLALESSTEEYRVAQGKLNTAFEAAGYGAETAQQAYNSFYGILGDTDTATEASQLLAKLADSAEDVSTWTDIAAGVAGTFGDSLPIEGLIEASNETAKVGQVTGVLADALNWAGISEDDFNARLSACSSESERNQLIMDTLSGTYDEASEAFYRNNEALVESRNNQAQLDATLATLGQTVSNVKNRLLTEFLPAISNVATAFSGMLSGAAGADQEFASAVQGLVNVAVSKLPEFLSMGVQILSSLASGIVQSIPTLVAAVPQIVAEIGEALTELLPQVLNMGVQLLDQLVSGIETGLPDMVARLPQIVDNFLSFLTEHLPDILDKGVEMLNSLVNGIINTIPQMVASLPKIITSFVTFIANNLPKIIEAGINILVNLIAGIIKAIPQLVAALPQIIAAIVDGIAVLMGSIVDIGKNIVEGIWEGIQNAIGWFTDKITGFFSGIIDGVKGMLGIHSPSRVFADMGKNMALGLGQGWDNEYDRIRRDIEGGMDFGTASVDFASSGLGVASAGMVNGVSASVQGAGMSGGSITVNLMMPDGTKFASYLLGPLSNYAKANGTPILHPT